MKWADIRSFPNIRKHSLVRQVFNMIETGSTIAESHIFNILIEMLSRPWDLLTLNDLIIITIFLFQI